MISQFETIQSDWSWLSQEVPRASSSTLMTGAGWNPRPSEANDKVTAVSLPCWVHLLLNEATVCELSSSKDWKNGFSSWVEGQRNGAEGGGDSPCGAEGFVNCEAGRFLRVDGAGCQIFRKFDIPAKQIEVIQDDGFNNVLAKSTALQYVILWNTHQTQCHTSLLYRM